MLLRLAPTVAIGRALFAAAAVVGSSTSHFLGAHAHAHLPTIVFAFFLLLGTAWRTSDPRILFLAAVGVQVVVHLGGALTSQAPLISSSMVLFHSVLAVLAWVLMWKFEILWSSMTSALQSVFGAPRIPTVTVPEFLSLFVAVPRRSPQSIMLGSTHVRRGPPALA